MSLFDRFFTERDKQVWEAHYTGFYRGIVVETNDPLRMHRVRIRILDLYRATEKAEQVLWAAAAPFFGGPNSGSWVSPSIGDHVWVTFERGHPYAPILVGFADPTRRKQYVLGSLYGPPPTPLDEESQPADKPTYENDKYLPLDNRPYSMGWRTPYGQEFIFNYGGFFRKTHETKPAEAGMDPTSDAAFEASKDVPKANDPDTKYIALTSGYGSVWMLNDVGHKWKEELKGDQNDDEQYLISRNKYMLDFFNEGAPKDKDQRRLEGRSRGGHKIEFRDVGWNKSRDGEFGKVVTLSDSKSDERWVKVRTKGGHYFQMIDIGFDAEKDKFYKRLNKSEHGTDTESEDKDLKGKDKRLIRLQSRHGNRLLLDDRGSDSKDAEKEEPRGHGISLSTPRGHTIEMADQDARNAVMVQTAEGAGFEANDRFRHVLVTTRTSTPTRPIREGRHGAEWSTQPVIGKDPEYNTNHLKLDEENKYVRLKTAARQGVEFRDRGSRKGCKHSWAEIRDEDDRGLWFNSDGKYAIWRSKPRPKEEGDDSKPAPVITPREGDTPAPSAAVKPGKSAQWIAIDENDKVIIIRNEEEEGGSIKIIADVGNIEIKAKNIALDAEERIFLKAGQEIINEGAGTSLLVRSGTVGTDGHFQCDRMSGTHTAIKIPQHPSSPAPSASTPGQAKKVEKKDIEKQKPDDEDEPPPCDDPPTKEEAEKAAKEWEDNADKREEIADEKEKAADEAQTAEDAAREKFNESAENYRDAYDKYQGDKTSSNKRAAQNALKDHISNGKALNEAKGASSSASNAAAAQRSHATQGRSTAESVRAVADAAAAAESSAATAAQSRRDADSAASAAKKAQKAADRAAEKAKDSGSPEDQAAADAAQEKADEAKEKADDAEKKAKEDEEKAKEDQEDLAKKCKDSPACECDSKGRYSARGCAPNKSKAGPIPPAGGGGGPGGNTPPSIPEEDDEEDPPPPDSPNEPDDPGADDPPPIEPEPPRDPIDAQEGGVVWYGLSANFLEEILEHGLRIESLANNEVDPDNPSEVPEKIVLAVPIALARGEEQAVLSQKRYGGGSLILRIGGVDEPDLLSEGEFDGTDNLLTIEYRGETISPEFIEIFEIGPELPDAEPTVIL